MVRLHLFLEFSYSQLFKLFDVDRHTLFRKLRRLD